MSSKNSPIIHVSTLWNTHISQMKTQAWRERGTFLLFAINLHEKILDTGKRLGDARMFKATIL